MRPIALALSCLALAVSGGLAQAAVLPVPLDRSVHLSFSGSAASVVLGNPEIADVTVVDSHNIFVSGRSFGSTDIHVLDADGRVLASADLVVSPSTSGHVRVYRGAARSDVSCSPVCESAQSSGAHGSSSSVMAGALMGAAAGALAARSAGAAANASPTTAASVN